MEPTTQYIIAGLLVFIFLGIIGWLYVEIYTANNNPDNCQAGTIDEPGIGCLGCDPYNSQCPTCTIGDPNACDNGNGTCINIFNNAGGVTGITGHIGYCKCNAPYFGANCDQICSDSIPCLNGGKCVNGGCQCPAGFAGPNCGIGMSGPCSNSNCIMGSCINGACVCKTGVVTNPNPNGIQCNACAPGFGPPGDCSKILFTTPTNITTPNCIDTSASSGFDKICKNTFGPTATYSGNYCSGNDGCAGANNNPIICTVGKFWANTNFIPTNPCPGNGTNSYNIWTAQGGEKYTPPVNTPPIGRSITTNHNGSNI